MSPTSSIEKQQEGSKTGRLQPTYLDVRALIQKVLNNDCNDCRLRAAYRNGKSD